MFRNFIDSIVNPGPGDRLEYEFENRIIVPLLTRWRLPYRRQVTCRMRKRGQLCLGRIDFLVHTADNQSLLTLFENKRHIYSEVEREQAAQQANAYARARRLRSFVVAAPEGLWIYSRRGGVPHLEASFVEQYVSAGAPEALALLVALRDRR